jgi:maleate isomerase
VPDTAVQSAPSKASAWQLMPCTLDKGPAGNVAIGLITLSNDTVIEPELYTFLPRDGVAVYSSRIPMAKTVSVETLKDMQRNLSRVTAEILPDDSVDVMAFGCTSGSMAIGPDTVAAEVQKSKPGVPVTNPVSASVKGLRKLGVRRIALLTPYPDDVNAIVESYVGGQGFDIAVRGSFKQNGDPQITRVPPEAIYEAGVRLGSEKVEGLFISCTALRCSPVIQRIEDKIGKPVVTSNQALAWDCLRLGGYTKPVKGYGRLMTV